MRIVINEEICCARSLIRYYEIVLKSPYNDGDNWDGFRDAIVGVGEWLEDDVLEIYHEGFPHLAEEELWFYAMTLKEAELAYRNDDKFRFIVKYSDKCYKRIDRETLDNYKALEKGWLDLYMDNCLPARIVNMSPAQKFMAALHIILIFFCLAMIVLAIRFS